MTIPWSDWQFWVVSAMVALAALWLLRGVLPGRRASKGQQRGATLTVGGRPVERRNDSSRGGR